MRRATAPISAASLRAACTARHVTATAKSEKLWPLEMTASAMPAGSGSGGFLPKCRIAASREIKGAVGGG